MAMVLEIRPYIDLADADVSERDSQYNSVVPCSSSGAGPAGFSLVVAAPDAEQRMRLERFVCAELDAAVEQASAWIRAGRPPREPGQSEPAAADEPRLSRTARPWR